MNEPDKNADIPAPVILRGRAQLQIEKLDGSKETADVYLTPLDELDTYHTLIGDIYPFIAFVCRKDVEWVKTLTPESVFEVDLLAKAINRPLVDRWLARQERTVEELKPVGRRISALQNTAPTQ